MEDISIYCIYGRQKRGDCMSSKMGRPTDNPKQHKVTVRLDDESKSILDKYCEQENLEKGEAVRRGIKCLKSKIK